MSAYSSPYRIEVWNPNTGQLVADISDLCTARHFVIRRNRPETIDLSLNLFSAQKRSVALGTPFNQLFAAGYNDIRVARGNRYLVGGQIGYTSAVLDSNGAKLDIRATGFMDLLKDRYLFPTDTLISAAVDVSTVAWTHIVETQSKTNGDFGITLGATQTSRAMDEQQQPFAKAIKDLLISYTELTTAPDIEFTPTRVFNSYFPGIGTDKSELRFAYPGNITALTLPSDATQLINFSINRGSGNGETQVVETRVSSPSQAIYKRREHVDDYPSQPLVAWLDSKGDETLRLSANPSTIPDITLDGKQEPYLGAYWIGDRIKLDVSLGSAFTPLDGQTWRINEIEVTIDPNDHETIRLKVGYS